MRVKNNMKLEKKELGLKKDSGFEVSREVVLLKDSQYRKELSIAYFNSLNSAIQLITNNKSEGKKTEKDLLKDISRIRDYFLNEYKQYRIDILDNVENKVDNKIVKGLDKAKEKYESQT